MAFTASRTMSSDVWPGRDTHNEVVETNSADQLPYFTLQTSPPSLTTINLPASHCSPLSPTASLSVCPSICLIALIARRPSPRPVPARSPPGPSSRSPAAGAKGASAELCRSSCLTAGLRSATNLGASRTRLLAGTAGSPRPPFVTEGSSRGPRAAPARPAPCHVPGYK